FLRELRRGGVRGSTHLRHHPRSQSPCRLRRRRCSLLRWCELGQSRDQPDVQCDRGPSPRHFHARRTCSFALRLAERDQGLPGLLRLSRGPLRLGKAGAKAVFLEFAQRIASEIVDEPILPWTFESSQTSFTPGP